MIHFFVGTKAQFIKCAPVMRALDERDYPYRLVDSRQHGEITAGLRSTFGLREPDFTLGEEATDVTTIRRGMRWLGTGLAGVAFRPRWLRERVFGGEGGICVVHGDTASTLLGALFARRAGLGVAHLEAGLRSHNLVDPFPEEIIRIVCMRLAGLLLAPDAGSAENLRRMGLKGRVVVTGGNTILDSLELQGAARGLTAVRKPDYVLVACHRLETIRSTRRLRAVVDCVNRVARRHGVLWVLHAPTENALRRHGLWDALSERVERLPLQDYFTFISLIRNARFVMADGGSIQEECSALGVPLLVLRERTERPDGIGTNARLIGFDPGRIEPALASIPDLRKRATALRGGPSALVADALVEWDRAAAPAFIPHTRQPVG